MKGFVSLGDGLVPHGEGLGVSVRKAPCLCVKGLVSLCEGLGVCV